MLNPTPTTLPNPEPAAPPEQRLEVLFRQVLNSAPARHLLELVQQYRKETIE